MIACATLDQRFFLYTTYSIFENVNGPIVSPSLAVAESLSITSSTPTNADSIVAIVTDPLESLSRCLNVNKVKLEL